MGSCGGTKKGTGEKGMSSLEKGGDKLWSIKKRPNLFRRKSVRNLYAFRVTEKACPE